VVLGSIGAHNQDDIGITNVCPVVGHGSATETFRQTGDSRGMSEPGLGFYIDHPQGTFHFDMEVAFLVVMG